MNLFVYNWCAYLIPTYNHRIRKEFHLTLAFAFLALACQAKYLHNIQHTHFLHSKIVRITQVIKRSETVFASHIQKRVLHAVYRPFTWQQNFFSSSSAISHTHQSFSIISSLENRSFSVLFNLDSFPFAILVVVVVFVLYFEIGQQK